MKFVICHKLGLENSKNWNKEEYSVQYSGYKTCLFFFTTSLSRHVKASIDRKTSKILLS